MDASSWAGMSGGGDAGMNRADLGRGRSRIFVFQP